MDDTRPASTHQLSAHSFRRLTGATVRTLIALAATALLVSACVVEPYGYYGGGYRGEHHGDHHHESGRRWWRN
jgi:hypothetical protein